MSTAPYVTKRQTCASDFPEGMYLIAAEAFCDFIKGRNNMPAMKIKIKGPTIIAAK